MCAFFKLYRELDLKPLAWKLAGSIHYSLIKSREVVKMSVCRILGLLFLTC